MNPKKSAILSAETVAQFFLVKQRGVESEITHMKLHKLLYYAQGFHLAMHDTALFPEPIERWPYGPVVPKVYNLYKHHGDAVIGAPEEFDASVFPVPVVELLDEVYDVYGQFSAWRLSDMTHAEAPWLETEDGKEIPVELLRSFFKGKLNVEQASA